MNMKYSHFILLSLVILSSLLGCTRNEEAKEKISRAESLLYSSPDSALAILDSLREEEGEWSTALKMRYELVYAENQNQAFIPFTTDSITLAVARYYDRHGSCNERMQAYYMVGSAYRDMGDAPTALKYFNMAVEAADTTDADCDRCALLRVHSQMSALFNNVCAFKEEMREYDAAESLAWETCDTITALRLMWMKATSLHVQERYDASVALIDSMVALEKRYGLPECVECNYPMRIDACLLRKNVKGADTLLREYESKLHYGPMSPDEDIYNISYHYHKGRYYLLNGQPDSAIYQFRRLWTRSPLYEYRELAGKGLQDAYAQKHHADSVIKYANLYCEANDSTTRHRSSEDLMRMQALYNYANVQEQALQIEKSASRLKILFSIVLFIMLCIAVTIWKIYKNRMQKINREQTETNASYLSLIQKLKNNISELQQLKTDTDLYLQKKEDELASLQKTLSLYNLDELNIEQWSSERDILDCNIASHLHTLSARGKKATQEEIENLCLVARAGFPGFYDFVANSSKGLSTRDISICTLIRFQFISSEIGVLLGLTPQRITNIKSTINRKLFEDTSAKTLTTHLSRLQ